MLLLYKMGRLTPNTHPTAALLPPGESPQILARSGGAPSPGRAVSTVSGTPRVLPQKLIRAFQLLPVQRTRDLQAPVASVRSTVCGAASSHPVSWKNASHIGFPHLTLQRAPPPPADRGTHLLLELVHHAGLSHGCLVVGPVDGGGLLGQGGQPAETEGSISASAAGTARGRALVLCRSHFPGAQQSLLSSDQVCSGLSVAAMNRFCKRLCPQPCPAPAPLRGGCPWFPLL